MTRLPQISRHWVGVSALALALIGLGIMANVAFNRPTESLSQIGGDQINQPGSAVSPGFISEHFISQLRRIPQNAFGSAQPDAQSLNASEDNRSRASEARNWTEEEWRLASAAVMAYRKGGREALSPTASSRMVWQPPEEIAKQKPTAR